MNKSFKILTNNEKLREKFIKFLKQNHAFKEYNIEVVASANYHQSIKEILSSMNGSNVSAIFEDGYSFFWKRAVTDVDWKHLHKKWNELLLSECENATK